MGVREEGGMKGYSFPIRFRLERLTVDRNPFLDELKDSGARRFLHWRPLHLNADCQETYRWRPGLCWWPRPLGLGRA